MNYHANPNFWTRYHKLPAKIQALADESFGLLKENPRHPSLHFKKAGRYWSVRVGNHYRALAVKSTDGVIWFWIGTHEEYNNIV